MCMGRGQTNALGTFDNKTSGFPVPSPASGTSTFPVSFGFCDILAPFLVPQVIDFFSLFWKSMFFPLGSCVAQIYHFIR